MSCVARPLEIAVKSAVDRRFAAILLLSLTLHLVVALSMLLNRQPAPPPPPILQASIRLLAPTALEQPVAPASQPTVSRMPVSPASAQKARQLSSRTEHRSVPSVLPTAGPANAPVAEPAQQVQQATVPPAAPAAPVAAAARAEVAEQLAAAALADYRRQLVELFARPRAYPRIAALRGWEGEVRLRLKVARRGNLLGIQVDRSSGFEVLDRDALAMLEAQPDLPPLPEALAANEISIVVPINYKLRKTS